MTPRWSRLGWDELRRRGAERLDRGGPVDGVLGRLAAAYGSVARVDRRFDIPDGARVIGVSGATLGGSGVTPVVSALAARLRERGRRVSVLSHGYGAVVSTPRRVSPSDDVRQVGDEALELARELGPIGVSVWVGRPRTAALAAAARGADVVLLDGVLQRVGGGLFGSLLVLDAAWPWGSGACPPRGNLRATPRALLGGASAVLWLPPPGAGDVPLDARTAAARRPVVTVPSTISVTLPGHREAPPSSLAARRVGLVLGVGRPERVVASLAALGVRPVCVVALADHATAESFHRHEDRLRGAGADVWLTTSKCATKLRESFAGAPLVALRRRLEIPEGLVDGLVAGAPSRPGRGPWLPAGGRAMVPPCSGTA